MNKIKAQTSSSLGSFLELKKRWMSFYEKLGLSDLNESLNSEDLFIDINKIKEAEDLKDLSILFMPPVEVQKKYLENLKNACEAFGIEILLSPWTVNKFFPKIKFLNRPNDRPYLFLTENEKEAAEETLNESPINLRESFEE